MLIHLRSHYLTEMLRSICQTINEPFRLDNFPCCQAQHTTPPHSPISRTLVWTASPSTVISRSDYTSAHRSPSTTPSLYVKVSQWSRQWSSPSAAQLVKSPIFLAWSFSPFICEESHNEIIPNKNHMGRHHIAGTIRKHLSARRLKDPFPTTLPRLTANN